MTDSPPHLSALTLAKLFQLDINQIEQLTQIQVIPKNAEDNYELVTSVRGYVMYLQERAQGQTDKTIDIKSQQLRRMKAQADALELELATLRQEYFLVEELKANWSRNVMATKTGFLAMSDRLAQMLSLNQTQRGYIDSEIRDALTQLSSMNNQDTS